MRVLSKIFFLFAISITILIVKEFVLLYYSLLLIDEFWAYSFLIFIALLLVYFALLPLVRTILIPRNFSPTKKQSEIPYQLSKRLKRFRNNKYLGAINFNGPKTDKEKYDESILVLEERVKDLRQQYIPQIFSSTAVSQNGFLDAIIILSSSINIVKEIFIVYNGRVSNRDLLLIGRKIYTAMAVGGSEGVEYATDEILSSFASDALKGIPFIDKVMGSIADGFVNAMLVTRISYITENYCKTVYVKNEKDLLPSLSVVSDTAKLLTHNVLKHIRSSIASISDEKMENFARYAVNPTGFVIDKAMNKYGDKISQDEQVKSRILNVMKITLNPIGYGFESVMNIRKKKTKK